VELHWIDWAIAALLLGAGCGAIYASLSRALRHVVTERQREMQRQMSALATTVKALQVRVTELGRLPVKHVEPGEAADAQTENAGRQEKETMKPEIVAALTAAATAFSGETARIRSAEQLADVETDAWAQQGRVTVQTSHNLRSNG
jgi:hypothetical protein